jgi:hypothetical protein
VGADLCSDHCPLNSGCFAGQVEFLPQIPGKTRPGDRVRCVQVGQPRPEQVRQRYKLGALRPVYILLDFAINRRGAF